MSRPNNLLRERSWLYDTLFLLVLFLAAYLRLTGVNWGEGQHQHPDENFFSSVAESLRARTCGDICRTRPDRSSRAGPDYQSESRPGHVQLDPVRSPVARVEA